MDKPLDKPLDKRAEKPMGKLEYLDALARAMAGLPLETQAKTLAYYEQRFVDGVGSGQSEQDVAQTLDDPKKIAMTLRANVHMGAFARKKNPANLARVLVSVMGLAIFNIFMLIPAMVLAAMLLTVYCLSLSSYVGGIAVTASGLSGANELVLQGPYQHMTLIADDDNFDDKDVLQSHVLISERGIQFSQEKAGERTSGTAVAGKGIRITTDLDTESRFTQTCLGLGMVIGGVLLFLVALVVTRYALLGARRYIDMNVSLVRGS